MSLGIWHMAFHDLTLYSRPLFLSSNCEPIIFISFAPTFGLERFSITVQRIILLILCQMFPHLWFFPESFSEDRTWTVTPHLSCLHFSYGISHTVRSCGFLWVCMYIFSTTVSSRGQILFSFLPSRSMWCRSRLQRMNEYSTYCFMVVKIACWNYSQILLICNIYKLEILPL